MTPSDTPPPRAEAPLVDRPVVGVGGVIFRPDRRVLLIRRARPPAQGTWSLPGGKVWAGEKLRDALKRETLEETSLPVSVGPLVDVVEVIQEGFHYVVVDFLCAPQAEPDSARAADDALDLCWVGFEELRSAGRDVTPSVHDVVARGLELLLA